MTDKSTIENKISSIQKYLKILERYKKFSKEDIENDIDRRGALERYLYLVCQATIDLAEALISLRNFRKPSTLSEAFHILNEEKIISNELTEKLVKMAGFRNVIAHDYEIVNYEIVIDALKKGTKDIEEFIKIAGENI